MGVNIGFRTKRSALRYRKKHGGKYRYVSNWKERKTLRSKFVRKPYVIRI